MSTNPVLILQDDHVAGGWTEHGTVARRICTALWKATDAFKRIENYHSDVVLDCTTIEDMVAKLEPGKSVHFFYSVGANGTMLMHGTTKTDESFILADSRGGNCARFYVSVDRSDYEVDSVTGTKWGADRYGLIVSQLAATATL